MGDHAPRRRGLSEAAENDVFPARAVDAELVEAGRRLFARECHFVAGAVDPASLPAESLPEVAFAGRSNVGKSSLVNALTGRRMLARVSHTPGRTRQINCFDLAGRLMLVDLPGYGYAEASKALVRRWTTLTQRYLRARATLRRVYLLVDARHGLKDIDRDLLRLCDGAGLSCQLVLTKVDKLPAGERAAVLNAAAGELAQHPAAHPELHLTSAHTSRGIAMLRTALAMLGRPPDAAVVPADQPQ
jgi:GTP-binding protein